MSPQVTLSSLTSASSVGQAFQPDVSLETLTYDRES